MPNTLPPLSALRAFEAASRLENFSRAADEIHVTHGAVSHQIKALEAYVGAPLFHRQGRGVTLTGDGIAFAAVIRDALARIGEAAQAIRRKQQLNRLTISVLPSFGARWLMPRIVKFMALHPHWEINIDSSPALADFARDGIDVAVRFGHGSWPGLHGEWLMDDEYILVASPALRGGRLPKHPGRLADYPMLRADPEPWRDWCAAAGIDLPLPTAGVDYQDMGVMLQSAVDAHGIMLTRRAVALSELEKGTLVQLFDTAVPAEAAYWIVWPEQPPASDRVIAFRDWIVAETAVAKTPPNTRRRSRPKTTR